jgi:hypothetical protein
MAKHITWHRQEDGRSMQMNSSSGTSESFIFRITRAMYFNKVRKLYQCIIKINSDVGNQA